MPKEEPCEFSDEPNEVYEIARLYENTCQICTSHFQDFKAFLEHVNDVNAHESRSSTGNKSICEPVSKHEVNNGCQDTDVKSRVSDATTLTDLSLGVDQPGCKLMICTDTCVGELELTKTVSSESFEEVFKSDDKVRCSFSCLACQVNLWRVDLILEHLSSQKHRRGGRHKLQTTYKNGFLQGQKCSSIFSKISDVEGHVESNRRYGNTSDSAGCQLTVGCKRHHNEVDFASSVEVLAPTGSKVKKRDLTLKVVGKCALYCMYCEVSLMSKSALSGHIEGKRHVNNVRTSSVNFGDVFLLCRKCNITLATLAEALHHFDKEAWKKTAHVAGSVPRIHNFEVTEGNSKSCLQVELKSRQEMKLEAESA